MIMHDYFLAWLKFRVSGIFQKSLGGRGTAVGRLMLFYVHFWVPRRNRLAVSYVLLGDTSYAT